MQKRCYIRYLAGLLTPLIISVFIPFTGFTQNIIKIKGSTDVLPVIESCFQAVMEKYPDISISIQGTDSDAGIDSLIDGTCHIANSSREIQDEEVYKAIINGVDPRGYVAAMDGIALIVNPVNPVKASTKRQIRDIYSGKISNWKKVGEGDVKIVVISQEETGDTFQTFNRLVLDEERLRSDAMLLPSDQAILKTVSEITGAIGYVRLGYVTDKVKAIQFYGKLASRKTVLAGEYPLSRPLYMYTNGKPKGTVKYFIDFVLSKEGQELIEKNGFIGLR
jgi:phosphate transport system substrate-binding protein